MRRIRTWHMLTGLLALMLAGCTGPVPATADQRGYPPDFALVFTVETDDEATAAAAEHLHAPAQHVVLADRSYRVALGPGAEHEYLPPVTARLSPQQMIELYRLTEAAGLLAAPPEPPSRAQLAAPVRYRLAVTAHGYRRRYVTTPDDRPAATLLLRRLVELRDGVDF